MPINKVLDFIKDIAKFVESQNLCLNTGRLVSESERVSDKIVTPIEKSQVLQIGKD
jgi:hypothetical protein